MKRLTSDTCINQVCYNFRCITTHHFSFASLESALGRAEVCVSDLLDTVDTRICYRARICQSPGVFVLAYWFHQDFFPPVFFSPLPTKMLLGWRMWFPYCRRWRNRLHCHLLKIKLNSRFSHILEQWIKIVIRVRYVIHLLQTLEESITVSPVENKVE